MLVRRQGRGRPSSIDLLPEDLRVQLNAALREKRLTQLEIVEHFNALLAQRGGESISKSALNRYAMHVESQGARLREAREAAQALVGKLGETAESDIGRAVSELIKTVAFDVVLNRDEDADAEDTMGMLKSLSTTMMRIERASKLGTDREMKIAEAAREEERQRLAEAVNAAGEQATKERLSPEEVLERVRAIYRGEA